MVPTPVADDIAKHVIPLLSGIGHVLERYDVPALGHPSRPN
jgi:LysR family transcriptional activator of mexEF-oprN operon